MDGQAIREAVQYFIDAAPCGRYLVRCERPTEHFAWRVYADDFGPETGNELIAVKRADGTIKIFTNLIKGL